MKLSNRRLAVVAVAVAVAAAGAAVVGPADELGAAASVAHPGNPRRPEALVIPRTALRAGEPPDDPLGERGVAGRDRARVRALALERKTPFFEVFVDAPLEVCEARDPKGLYAKARRGELAQFTGISSPYEPPQEPSLTLRTDQAGVEACVTRVLDLLLPSIRPRK